MAPTTRSKRTLAEADPNADMGARAKKATKETMNDKNAPPKGKTTTKKDAKTKGAAKGKCRDKENEEPDHCAGCGKGLAPDEGTVVNDKGESEPVAESGPEREKAVRAIAIANGEKDGARGKGAENAVARGKGKGKDAAKEDGKTGEKIDGRPVAKGGKKNAAAEPTDGGEQANSGNQNSAGGDSGSAKTNTGAKEGTSKASASKKDFTSKGASESTKAASKPSKATKTAQSYEWITVCRPQFDILKEDEENGVDEDEEEIDEGKDPRYTHYDKQTCKCQKPADESPGYTWVFTKAGYDQYLHWVDEQSKRDQDSFGMHIFSDWSGNGIVEVMENQFIDFTKEMTKKNPRILPLWSKIEGMALWLNTDLFQWGGIEDADRKNTQIVALYGVALLSTISLLIKKDEFHENSTIKNLGLILGLFIEFALSSGSQFCDDCDEGEGNDNWTKRVLQLAEKHGVKIAGSWGIEKRIENLRDEMDTDDEESVDETGGPDGSISPKDLKDLGLAVEGKDEEDWEDEVDEAEGTPRSWKTWNWAKEFAVYVLQNEETGIGGKGYDITKMSKREKKQYEYGRH